MTFGAVNGKGKLLGERKVFVGASVHGWSPCDESYQPVGSHEMESDVPLMMATVGAAGAKTCDLTS